VAFLFFIKKMIIVSIVLMAAVVLALIFLTKTSTPASPTEETYPTSQDDCAAGETFCDDINPTKKLCANLQTDTRNCGGCRSSCNLISGELGEPSPCSGGVCEDTGCKGGEMMCNILGNTYCANINTDSLNCGECGTECPLIPGSSERVACIDGQCQNT